jgi:hypothetical protein
MKKLLAIIVTALVLTGCMTANMLEAERSYYQAIVKLQAAKAAQPLFELTPAKEGEPIVLGNVGSFKVYAPVAGSDKEMRQYTQTDYVGPWLRVVSAALPWIGAWGVAHEMGKAAGDTITSYNQSVSGTGNSATVKTSAMSTGAMGDGNSLTGMSEINDSYNPTTTTTTTTSTDDHSTDDHSTDDHSVPLEE